MTNSKSSKQIAVVMTVSPWDEPKRLRKQLAEVLAREMEVIYITLPYGMLKPKIDSDRTIENVRIISFSGPFLPMRLLVRFSILKWMYERILAWRIKLKLPPESEIKVIFCFIPSYPSLLMEYPRSKVIYVANDDHASMPHGQNEASRIARLEQLTISYSKCVVSVSETLARKLAKYGRPVHVMYPGHDSTVYPLSRFLSDKRKSRSTCFFGYIDWRINFSLLKLLLEHGWSVTLIGKIVNTEIKINQLKELFRNQFSVLDPIASERAPEVLSNYQILIIPYIFKNIEQAADIELLNKTYVYFSALRPIVITWMPNYKFVEPGMIYRAKTHADFLECCERAIKEDSEVHAMRRSKLASENNWDARRKTIREIIDGTAIPLDTGLP